MKRLILSLSFILFSISLSAQVANPAFDFCVATNGSDSWAGKLAAPDAGATDGPFATVARAQSAVRQLRQQEPTRKAPVVVLIRGGQYFLNLTLAFGPGDSGTSDSTTVYRAWPGEEPILSGGRKISSWTVTPEGRWQTTLNAVKYGGWRFSQLFVGDERRYRPRLPRQGYYYVKDGVPQSEVNLHGADRFWFYPGDMKPNWQNLADIEFIAIHAFNASIMRISQVNEVGNLCVFTGPIRMFEGDYVGNRGFYKGNRYIVDNVKEAFGDPGQWYLETTSGVLTYIPKPGETTATTEVIAPYLDKIVTLNGDVPNGKWVSNIRFEGLSFQHTNWKVPAVGYGYAQADAPLPGAIHGIGVRNCVFEKCKVSHTATYGIRLGLASNLNTIHDCELTDLGAGGILFGEDNGRPNSVADPATAATSQTADNNLVAHIGRIFPGAVGIWVGNSSGNRVSHNDIYDTYYTGISVGWIWGYVPTLAHDNIIEFNHIYDCAQGVLADVGLIYTLGTQPGTVLRNNLLHDLEGAAPDGNGIYLDEGSTDILVENNIVYHARGTALHVNYGRNCTLRNNIFALAGDWMIDRARLEAHNSFIANQNIFYWDQGVLFGGTHGANGELGYVSDRNLYWKSGRPVDFLSKSFADWKTWSKMDANSLISDPMFEDPAKGDFRLKSGSPAPNIGFKPIDMSQMGRLMPPLNTAAPTADRKTYHPAFPTVTPFYLLPPERISLDFEAIPVGDKPRNVYCVEETTTASITVSDTYAATGNHSLRIRDMAGLNPINPWAYMIVRYSTGTLAVSFYARIHEGENFYHEWRDAGGAYHSGPLLLFDANGYVKTLTQTLMPIPRDKWVRYEIICPLGAKADGKYTLNVYLPGEKKPHVFTNLPCDPNFYEVRWLGWVSHGPAGDFYLDDVSAHLIGEPTGAKAAGLY